MTNIGTELKELKKPLVQQPDISDVEIAQEVLAAGGVVNPQPNAVERVQILPYLQFSTEPKIPFKGLPLVLLPGILISGCYHSCNYLQIPTLEFLFVSMMVSFLVNYSIIRKHDLYPFLPNNKYDLQLKGLCLLGMIVFITTVHFGWNGSGGIIVAVMWEVLRGNRIGNLWYVYLGAIVGAVLLEPNYSYTKLFQLIPGVLVGIISSGLFTLRTSQPYTIYHQFSLICTLTLPIFFPMQVMVQPSLIQWVAMLAGGLVTLFTGLLLVKMMQSERVSVVVTVFCSILILLCTSYASNTMIGGAVLTVISVVLLLRAEYFTSTEEL